MRVQSKKTASTEPYYLGSTVARILVAAIALGMLAHVGHAGSIVVELMGAPREMGDWFSGDRLGVEWLYWGWGLSIVAAVPLWLCWLIQGQLVEARHEGRRLSWMRFLVHLVAGGASVGALAASFGEVLRFRVTGRWPLEDADLRILVIPALVHVVLAMAATRVVARRDRVHRWQTRLEPRPAWF